VGLCRIGKYSALGEWYSAFAFEGKGATIEVKLAEFWVSGDVKKYALHLHRGSWADVCQ